MICRSHGHLQPLLLCLMPRIDGYNTVEMPHARITLAHTSSRCIIHVSLMTLDPDKLPTGAVGLQQAVNWLGWAERSCFNSWATAVDLTKGTASLPFVVKGHSKVAKTFTCAYGLIS